MSIYDALLGDREFGTNTQRLCSIAFLLIASVISLIKYDSGWLGIWTTEITPGLISTAIAISMICPLYLRKILHWRKNFFGILSLILITSIIASLIELASGGGKYSSSTTLAMLGAAIALSWFGIRAIAGLCWVFVILSALVYAVKNDVNMGIYGFAYIVSAFLGLVLHSGLNPGNFVQSLKEAYGDQAHLGSETIKSDSKAFIETIDASGKFNR